MNEQIEQILRNPAWLKTAEGDAYTDDTAAKWAWLAHGYDTGMEPFYSIEQLREAVRASGVTELLEALKHAVDWLNSAGIAETMPVQQQARAAIAKAGG